MWGLLACVGNSLQLYIQQFEKRQYIYCTLLTLFQCMRTAAPQNLQILQEE